MIDYKSFKQIFPKSFVKKLRESIVTFNPPIKKEEICKELFNEIISFTYYPGLPRDYIVFNKYNHVARIVPTFYAKDYFLYYFCLKMLEDEIAENRVDGTYGGWRLGNKIMLKEKAEEYCLDTYVPNSFNPFLWMENWQDFQRKAYQYSRPGEYRYFIYFDISSFYDHINLELLNRKIYLVAPQKKRFYVELLFHFLHNWNKKIEGYSDKIVGLPQDEIGDCSRILANFYLQDYDGFMKDLCDKNKAQYLRYADDQIIYSEDRLSGRKILFEASKYLFKIGLDINSGKVLEFDDPDKFNKYWAFQIFELFRDKADKNKINEGIKLFLKWKEENINFREYSVLKKIIGLDFKLIEASSKHKILSILLEKEFISDLDWWRFNKIYNQLDGADKKDFLNILNELVDEVQFNSFHYNLRKFYQKNKLPYDKKRIYDKIKKLRI
jgi:hypothetical protein